MKNLSRTTLKASRKTSWPVVLLLRKLSAGLRGQNMRCWFTLPMMTACALVTKSKTVHHRQSYGLRELAPSLILLIALDFPMCYLKQASSSAGGAIGERERRGGSTYRGSDGHRYCHERCLAVGVSARLSCQQHPMPQ